jgi:hypothetical protein
MRKHYQKDERFLLSKETQLLVDMLSGCKPGDVVTYKRVSELVGQRVKGSQYNPLQSALRVVERDRALVFKNISGIGYECQSASEIATNATPLLRKKVGGASQRVGRKIATIHPETEAQLQASERESLNIARSLQGVITAAMSRPYLTRVTQVVVDTGHPVNIRDQISVLAEVDQRRKKRLGFIE